MSRGPREPGEPDEFSIPRPRWIVPVAIVGLLFLAAGLVYAAFFAGGSNPEVRYTGGTPAVVTTVAPTTTR